MNISRPCYDKYHRCPRWAGPGLRYAKERRCADGHVVFDPSQRLWKWRIHRCDRCDVLVLPYLFRWVDPTWLRDECRRGLNKVRYDFLRLPYRP